MTDHRPVEIIGGGLAGLSLGLALQRAGTPTTIHETGTYPRHRVCGEFVAGLDARTVAQLDLGSILEDALLHRNVAWVFSSAAPPLMRSLPAPALGLSRYVLDARLADQFVEAGGELRQGTRATDLRPQPGRIFACGRRRGPSAWIGLKVHAANFPLLSELEMHLGENAYVGVARLPGGFVNLCGLFRRRTLAGRKDFPASASKPHPLHVAERTGIDALSRYLDASGLSTLAARLRSAQVEPGSFCSVAALCFGRGTWSGDRICLGDAYAMIPPFTGNGMAMAFQSAAVALDPVLQYSRNLKSWQETVRATNAAIEGRFRLRLAAAGMLHRFVLQPDRQRWFSVLSRAHLLPFRPLFAMTH